MSLYAYTGFVSYSFTSQHENRLAASDAVLAVKDSHIASLQAELWEKERILQNKSKVRAGFYFQN